IDQTGIQINGQRLAHSKALATDPGGRPLPKFERANYTLAENELLLIGDVSPASFDSRYFGLIDRAHIKGVVRPVFTW
ncbi:S26 family signal peptidase, partial [Ventosimonas gracilis]|uniref:S26 family signal peptidase n=1 Tax=Ventosimonas gracilis TaxID=1680762 RepID=UPI0018727225